MMALAVKVVKTYSWMVLALAVFSALLAFMGYLPELPRWSGFIIIGVYIFFFFFFYAIASILEIVLTLQAEIKKK